jgi:hypothetical protein
MANQRFDPRQLESPPRGRALPWVMLCVPFFFLLVLVLWMVSRGDFSERLAKVGASERAQTELYAIEKTPASTVALLLVALKKSPGEWSASERWAIEDLHQRGGKRFNPQEPLANSGFLERFRLRWSHSATPEAGVAPGAVR